MIARISVMALLSVAVSCTGATPLSRLTCRNHDFKPAPYDHIIEEVASPFIIRELRGRLAFDPGDIPGGWPETLDPRLELHGPNGFVKFVPINDDGSFIMRGLQEGEYCFKVSAIGARSVIGHVVITPDSPPDSLVEIRMLISE